MVQTNRLIRPRSLKGLEKQRSKNLRQLLLRTSRAVNAHVVQGLQARGYTKLRSTHTTLLSNLPLAGASVTEVAERAGISKQAMGRLASELELAGYLKQTQSSADARVRLLSLTAKGARLMLDSFEVMKSLQKLYADELGKQHIQAIMRGLTAFLDHEFPPAIITKKCR